MKKERKRDHTRGKKQGLGQKSSGEDEGVREKCLGEKRKCFCRDRSKKMRSEITLDLFIENASRWIEIHQGSIKN